MEDQNACVYQYYLSIYSDEHFLSATEIAQGYGVMTEKGKPHSKLVSAYLDGNCEYKIFYPTGKGYMMRVYSKKEYAAHMFNFIKNSVSLDSEIKSITLENNSKAITYKYKTTN